jgi:hypothetical protein
VDSVHHGRCSLSLSPLSTFPDLKKSAAV